GQTTTRTGDEFTASGLQNGETVGAVELSSAGSAATANVSGSPYAITAGNATGGTFNAGNYTITYNDGALTISPASLTVTANNAAKTYGQTTAFTGAEFSASGLQNGETIGSVTLDSAGSAATANVTGSPYTITADNATGGTFNAGNYTITYNDGALTIAPAALTVTASNAAKTYGQAVTFTGSEFTTSGLQNGETIGSVTLNSAGSAATANVSGSPYAITANNATGGTFNAGNYTITYQNGALTIAPRPITVTAMADIKPYDGTTLSAAVPTITVGSLAGGDTAIFSQTYDTKNAGPGKTLTPTAAISDGNNGNNYAVTYVTNTSGVIMPRSLTVTATAASKTYDGTTTAEVTYNDNRVAGDSLTINGTAAFLDKDADSGKTVNITGITLGGADKDNYTANPTVTAAASITPADLTVTADDASRNTGQANPPFTATYSGLVNGETPASLSGSLIFDTTATSSSPAGSYAITLTGTLDARNYSIRYVDGVLTVQSVTNPAYTGAVGTAGQTASGGITGNGFGPNGYWGRGSGFGGGAGGIFGPLYTIAGSGINLTGLGLPGQNQQ
ncbi:MAG: MBG domain-containing protein, partial [Bacillota bacterium]